MKVRDFDIDGRVADILEAQGITDLYPPQERALPHVLDGKNVVLAIPTASGKSLVAYLAMIKAVLRGRKALYIVPLRALAAEKFEELSAFKGLGITLGMSIGDLDAVDPQLDYYDILVATSEKTDSLMRHRADWFSQLAVVIVDEIHLINDPDRGPTLETIIARLRQINTDVQIIALSATIKNSEEIASWLQAEHIQSEWRPVALKKGVFFGNTIEFDDGTTKEVKAKQKQSADKLASLVQDTIDDGGQTLIFVNSRRSAESLAEKLGALLGRAFEKKDEESFEALAETLTKSQSEATSVGDSLARCVKNGVAYHHAGLTNSQRALVEKNFKNRMLKCIVATPTLAAGINLPARRVIIRDVTRYDANFGQSYIPVLEVHQMMGRAGRPKYDMTGEAILIAKSLSDKEALTERYLRAESEKIYSKLGSESALRTNLLATIATGFVRNYRDMERFIDATFYAEQGTSSLLNAQIQRVLKFLEENNFIKITAGDNTLDGRSGENEGAKEKTSSDNFIDASVMLEKEQNGKNENDAFVPTRLGKRVSELYLDPLSAIKMVDAFSKIGNKKCTPFSFLHIISTTPDMQKLYLRRSDYDPIEQEIQCRRNEFLLTPADSTDYEGFMCEVKTALLLEDWINEKTENDIVQRFGVGPGDIRNMSERANWLLYSMRELVRLLHYDFGADLLHVIKRVRYGIKDELIQLVALRGIGRVRARALYNAGLKTIEQLRQAPVEQIARVPKIGMALAQDIKNHVDEGVREQSEETDMKETEQTKLI